MSILHEPTDLHFEKYMADKRATTLSLEERMSPPSHFALTPFQSLPRRYPHHPRVQYFGTRRDVPALWPNATKHHNLCNASAGPLRQVQCPFYAHRTRAQHLRGTKPTHAPY